jgi:hypothetical protein
MEIRLDTELPFHIHPRSKLEMCYYFIYKSPSRPEQPPYYFQAQVCADVGVGVFVLVLLFVGAAGVVADTDCILALVGTPHLESCYTRLVNFVDNAATCPSPLAAAAG